MTISGLGAQPTVVPVRVGCHTWAALEAVLNDAADLPALDARFNELGEPFEQHVVMLTVTGVVDFATRKQLDRLLSKWRGRFTWLGDDCSQLVEKPTEADLDRIDTAGFVRAAMERLRAIQSNPADADHETAASALRLLYQIHTTGGENQ